MPAASPSWTSKRSLETAGPSFVSHSIPPSFSRSRPTLGRSGLRCVAATPSPRSGGPGNGSWSGAGEVGRR
jgi:hypothetical protein